MSAITVQPIAEPGSKPQALRPRLVLVPTGSDAQGLGRTAPTGPVRLTRRGRLVLTLMAMGIVVTAGFGASTAFASPAAAPRTITVEAGQTLSEIAASQLPGMALGDAIVEIQVASSLSSDQVHAGQTLTIPAG